MMTCSEAAPLLAELSGLMSDSGAASLPPPLMAAERHANDCATCGARLQQLLTSRDRMRAAREVALPEGFTRELHRKLVAAPPPKLGLRTRLERWTRLHPLSALGLAAALSAALVMIGTGAVLWRTRGIGPLQSGAWDTAAATPRFEVPAEKVALVKIDFASAKAIDDVDFEVLLPDGLRFYSGGRELAERTFHWRANLSAGSNVVPIAVKGARPGRYRVIAHATGADLDVSEEVILEVT